MKYRLLQSESSRGYAMTRICTQFLLISILAAMARGDAPPVAWKSYQVWLWTFGDRRLDEAFLKGLRPLGITGINREGRASAGIVARSGMTFYVGHAVGKGYLHLRRQQFQPHWDRYWKTRDARHLNRPACLRDPAVLEAMKARLAKSVSAQNSHRPLAYSLDDEISLTRRVTPLDFCFCPHCLEGFRAWLKTRYGSLDRLNDRWRTAFKQWEEVVPLTADEIKNRERLMPLKRWVLEPWADHRSFMDQVLADTLAMLRSEARRLDVAVPVGFLGGQAPAPYGGYDWGRLLESVDWVEAYDQGGAMEVIRGLGPDVLRVRTYFRAGKGEGLNRHRLWKYFAHGDRGAILWSDREILNKEGDPTPYARGLLPTLNALTSPDGSRILGLPVAHDPIAVYYSQASLRVSWMLDSRADGRTWMKRFGSYEVKHSSLYKRRRAWHRYLEDAGVQYRYVDARDVMQGRGLEDVRLVVLPGIQVMEPEEVRHLKAFLERGGLILADRPGPGLNRFLAHRRVVFLRTPPVRYLDSLAGADGNPAALEEVAAVLDRAGIRPPCRARDERGRPGGLEVIRRPARGGSYFFVLRNLLPEEEETLTREAWSRPRSVTLEFPSPVKAREVFGSGRWEGKILKHEVAADRPWVFFLEAS